LKPFPCLPVHIDNPKDMKNCMPPTLVMAGQKVCLCPAELIEKGKINSNKT